MFEPVLSLYEPHFECIPNDNRGSRRSSPPRWPTSMPQLAADVARLLDALGVESAHVYGVSMGGMIAQELAIRFPKKVRGLILGGTTPGARARRGLPPASHNTLSRLHRIQAPTLVTHGELDAIAPLSNARLLADRIPEAELATLRAGHAFALECPEESLALMLEWFSAREPIRPGARKHQSWGRAEPITRAFGLPLGALRTGASLAGLAREACPAREGLPMAAVHLAGGRGISRRRRPVPTPSDSPH